MAAAAIRTTMAVVSVISAVSMLSTATVIWNGSMG